MNELLAGMEERELYRLAFDISEELVAREASRLTQYLSAAKREQVRVAHSIVGRYEIARPTPKKIDTFSVHVDRLAS